MAKSKWDYIKSRFPEVEKWARDGLTEIQIAHNLGISKSTFENYKVQRPDFLSIIKIGKQGIIAEVENALVKRALGFEYTEEENLIEDNDGKVIKKKRKTTKYYAPDVGACAILLKNKDRDNWSDNPQMLDLKREMLELEKKKLEDLKW